MEVHTRQAELQKTAEVFLHGIIWSRRGNVDDAAKEVIKLILEDDPNPLTDLVKARYRKASEPRSPTTPKPHSSKLSFRFSRNRDKDRQQQNALEGPSKTLAISEPRNEQCMQESRSESPTGVPFAAGGKTSSVPHSQPNNSLDETSLFCLPTGLHRHNKAPDATPPAYSCCYCQTDYTAKGTCKRHLEDLHVSRKTYKCEKCTHTSRTVPEAKKHTGPCSAGILGWTTLKPASRLVYSSEFTSELFPTEQRYITHLLEQSALPKHERPRESWHLKLRNLLGQRFLEHALREWTCHHFDSPTGWRAVRWDPQRARRAIRQLEYGILEPEPGESELLRSHRVRTFIEELFADRLPLPGAKERKPEHAIYSDDKPKTPQMGPAHRREPDPSSTAHGSVKTAGAQQMASTLAEPDMLQVEYYGNPLANRQAPEKERNGKRPLSYETAIKIPHRQPPGPPAPNLEVQPRTRSTEVAVQPLSQASSNLMEAGSWDMAGPGWPLLEQPPPYNTASTTSLAYPDFDSGQVLLVRSPNDTTVPADLDTMDFANNEYVASYSHQQGDLLNFYTQAVHLGHGQMDNYHAGDSGMSFSYQPTDLTTAADGSDGLGSWFDASDASSGDLMINGGLFNELC